MSDRSTIIEVPPRFRVVIGPWDAGVDERTIVLGPSHAFGDGRHESTRMCLQALASFAPRSGFRLFDVGSGTGILSIGAAKLGGEAIGVDIDAAAIAIAADNARRSAVEARVSFATTWPDATFDIVVANILRDVLTELAPLIVARLAPLGTLILSGLVSTDVPEIVARYAPLLAGRRPEIFERDTWRTLVWRPSATEHARDGHQGASKADPRPA
ncbi:50S ribosomal protein L11 methyltransferase [Sorangium sp. So ce136]|uniref:50S ribosomal protein L11 methyltransferase n=1 Tax=Sorangium sp. So ce136 TaxID=3133284 RepID=UPI003F02361D